jgi:hypothetical protein
MKLDPASRCRLIAWVDAMGSHRGEPEVRAIPDPDFEGIEDFAIRPQHANLAACSTPLTPEY